WKRRDQRSRPEPVEQPQKKEAFRPLLAVGRTPEGISSPFFHYFPDRVAIFDPKHGYCLKYNNPFRPAGQISL
ncbi:MAG: hypothetical protein KDC30_21450, partial [Saprospiraceae bacterium]|nr:hypothetical protein [Saprospiraceae bacterium]